jgi:serine protease Do
MATQGFGDVAERLRRSTVHITLGGGRERGSGSGIIWSSDGLILTNAHVARGPRATVELWDGRRFEADVQSRDDRRDLVSLRIATHGLTAATPGDSTKLRAGELVLAVGNPMGFLGALTTGVVHGQGPLRGLGRQSWVQAAVRLAPGNSGGPLADAQGRVIGVNTMVVSGGLALAVPSQAVVDFVAHGNRRPALGVTVRPVEGGLLVLEVAPNGPAAQASLMIGDLLLFPGIDDLTDAVDSAPAGVLTLSFLRGDRRTRREVHVRLFALGAAA